MTSASAPVINGTAFFYLSAMRNRQFFVSALTHGLELLVAMTSSKWTSVQSEL
jgi:hypothetical protein